MSNRDLLRQFADGTPLSPTDINHLVECKLIGNTGTMGSLAITTAGRILLVSTLLPPGDSASCPDTDSYFPPPQHSPGGWIDLPVPPDRSALNVQEGGDHYKNLKIQPVEFIEANGIPFLEGCVIKRMCRHGSKAKAEDLRKAIHEITLLLELRYGEKL